MRNQARNPQGTHKELPIIKHDENGNRSKWTDGLEGMLHHQL